jgi:superfamily II DNA/RNA helicase
MLRSLPALRLTEKTNAERSKRLVLESLHHDKNFFTSIIFASTDPRVDFTKMRSLEFKE